MPGTEVPPPVDSFLLDRCARPAKNPLLFLAAFFCLGIAAGLLLDLPAFPLITVTLLNWLLAALGFRRRHADILLCVACLLQGALSGTLTRHPRTGQMLETIISQPRAFVHIEGRIVGDPIHTPSRRNDESSTTELHIEADAIWWTDQPQPARAGLRVFVRDAPADTLEHGQRWRIPGLLRAPRHTSGRARHTMYADFRHMQPLGESPWRLRTFCFRARRAGAALLARGLPADSEAIPLLKALLLGSREELSGGLREAFTTTGTFHIFAISGLHVGMVAVLLIGVLKLLGISREHWFWGLAPLLILYTLGTGARASAVRACVMALIYWSAPALRRRPNGLSALALAALLILLVDPSQLFHVGFIMSFTVVLGIMLLYPPLAARWHSFIAPDPYRIQPEGPCRRALRSALRQVGNLFCLSLAAWLASMPITAYYFNIFCPITLLGNVFIVPGAFLVVFTGFLSLLSGMVFPLLSELFNAANALFIHGLLHMVRFMAAVPYGHRYINAPPPWAIAAWYAGLLVFFFGQRRGRQWALASLVLGSAIALWLHTTNDAMHMHVLDVGHGQAVHIQGPGSRHQILVDAGPEQFAHRVLRHLRRTGINRLHALVLTHPDTGHMGAAPLLLDPVPINEIWCADPDRFSAPFRETASFALYTNLLADARSRGILIRYLHAGHEPPLADASLEVCWPDPTRHYATAADASLVLHVGRGSQAVLLMGGARRRVENHLIETRYPLAAPLLLVGSHGMEGTCSETWLDYVRPRHAIISVGTFNLANAPHPGTLQRLQKHGAQIWRTDKHGTLRIDFPSARKPADTTKPWEAMLHPERKQP